MTSADVARIFKKRWFKHEEVVHMQLQGTEATATKAVYMGARELPRIVAAFKVPHSRDPKSGQGFDAIEIEMDLYAAVDFLQQLIHTVDAATPHRPRGAGQYQFGE